MRDKKNCSFFPNLAQQVVAAYASVRQTTPLVHNITNLVVMHTTANAMLAAGASPLMAHCPDELDDMLSIASALVLNIGTLDTLWVLSMRQAGRIARARHLPVVLDPVGAGASALRTATALNLLEEVQPCVTRGNASEIMALDDASVTSKGVDSLRQSTAAIAAGGRLAKRFDCVISISGAEDFITDGKALARVRGGSPLMEKSTGMGCSATALTAACVAGAKAAGLDAAAFIGAVAAMALMAEAGDRAAANAAGPGSFLIHFLDALYTLEPESLAAHVAELVLPD